MLTRGGVSTAAPGTWCGCGLEPTLPSQAAWGHLSGHLPFSCERQVGHDMGTGDCHLFREGIVLRATHPMTRAGVGQLG